MKEHRNFAFELHLFLNIEVTFAVEKLTVMDKNLATQNRRAYLDEHVFENCKSYRLLMSHYFLFSMTYLPSSHSFITDFE